MSFEAPGGLTDEQRAALYVQARFVDGYVHAAAVAYATVSSEDFDPVSREQGITKELGMLADMIGNGLSKAELDLVGPAYAARQAAVNVLRLGTAAAAFISDEVDRRVAQGDADLTSGIDRSVALREGDVYLLVVAGIQDARFPGSHMPNLPTEVVQ